MLVQVQLMLRVISEVVGGSITAKDYEKGSAFEFKTTRDVIIAGATGAATTSIQVTRGVDGTSQGALTVGESISSFKQNCNNFS